MLVVIAGVDRRSQRLDRFGSGKKTAVERINNWLSTDLPTTKEAAIETFDSVLASLDFIEFEVDVTLRVWIERNVYDMAILFFTLRLDVILEFLDPDISFLSVRQLVCET